jgi:hypothetical protein
MASVSAAPTAPRQEVTTPQEQHDLEGIDFGVKKSMRYHSRRRAALERWDNWTNWIVAVTGASAFAAIVGSGDHASTFAKVLTFAVAAISLADVIFSFGARSRLHQDLYRRFAELAVEVSLVETATSHDISRLRAKRLTIEADEPHVIDALERWCWNEEAEARGQMDARQPLTGWQRLVARFS